VQELGIDDYNLYHYNSNGSEFVFSVQLPNEDYVGISDDNGLEEGLDEHLSLNE
jgi:general secretion pathway protein G